MLLFPKSPPIRRGGFREILAHLTRNFPIKTRPGSLPKREILAHLTRNFPIKTRPGSLPKREILAHLTRNFPIKTRPGSLPKREILAHLTRNLPSKPALDLCQKSICRDIETQAPKPVPQEIAES